MTEQYLSLLQKKRRAYGCCLDAQRMGLETTCDLDWLSYLTEGYINYLSVYYDQDGKQHLVTNQLIASYTNRWSDVLTYKEIGMLALIKIVLSGTHKTTREYIHTCKTQKLFFDYVNELKHRVKI